MKWIKSRIGKFIANCIAKLMGRSRFEWLLFHSSNIVTWARAILATTFLILIFIVGAYGNSFLHYWTAILWLLLALGDLLDGYLARKFKLDDNGNLVDDGGNRLDELSDKFIIDFAFAILAFFGYISWYFVIIMVARDFFTHFTRGRLSANLNPEEKRTIKTARGPGKTKTFCQSVTIAVAFLPEFPNKSLIVLFLVSLSTILSVISGMEIFVRTMNARSKGSLLERTENGVKITDGVIHSANWVTMTRIALSPIIGFVFIKQPFGDWSNFIGTILMLVAIFTDTVDGAIARSHNGRQKTKAGAMLDVLADKIIFYFCLIGLGVATHGTFMIQSFNVDVVFYTSIICITVLVLHDFIFVGGYAYAKKLGGEPETNWVDKIRFWLSCAWIVIVGCALTNFGAILNRSPAWERAPFDLVFPYCSYFVLLVSMIFSCITVAIAYAYIIELRKKRRIERSASKAQHQP